MFIVVSGMIAGHPGIGGATWAVLQYVLGLKALGHDVLFIEELADETIIPHGATLEQSANAGYFRRVTHDFGLEDSAILLRRASLETVGAGYRDITQAVRQADLLLNLSGTLSLEELLGPIPVRVYFDLDPAFTQFWHVQGIDMGFKRHTHFATVGLAVGERMCSVPTCGLNWISSLQPVVLNHWPIAGPPLMDALTTVGNWRGYGSVHHGGVHYGQKVHSLRPLFSLPKVTGTRFVLAMSIHREESEDLAALHANGWELANPAEIAETPYAYQNFIQNSWAEFGIAKSGYVASRCGWFSDRSICYLASGRPVIAQDTGFSHYLPCGTGLFAFHNSGDVVTAIESIKKNYSRHATAARKIAEEHFDSAKVLPSLLSSISDSISVGTYHHE